MINSKNAEHWGKVLINEFKGESDRAAVILTVSIFENVLGSLLKSYLVPIASSTDSLFDNSNAPLASFSAKINFAHRIGLISTKFSRDLHIIRKIRNEFAHNIQGCNFESASVKQRILELQRSSKISKKESYKKVFGDNARGNFLLITSWMLWSLNSLEEELVPLKETTEEFGYHDFSKMEKDQKEE